MKLALKVSMKWLGRQQILAKLSKLWTSASTAPASKLGISPGENQPLRGETLTLCLTLRSVYKQIHTPTCCILLRVRHGKVIL